jgi:predicted phage baseplate assembly protein
VGGNWVEQDTWRWRPSFVGVASSEPLDRDFVLDDGVWDRVAGYRRAGGEIVHRDYVGGPGTTVRFGDGEFGLIPADATVFQVAYRLGNGRRGNVAAGSITGFDQADPAFAAVDTVDNPLPAAGGQDPETIADVRRLAPEAFRAVAYRAVRPEDYAGAAERLAWVQRAGSAFRWTGSWLTAFVTPDPRGSVVVTTPERAELTGQLDRFRQASREACVLDPDYADLDLRIGVCVDTSAYPGEVKERLLQALVGEGGFFSPDNFTFGTPLERSRLEAAIQQVPGVRAVEAIEIRRRGWFDWRPFADLTFPLGDAEVLRVANDPAHPERGSLRLAMDGGA